MYLHLSSSYICKYAAYLFPNRAYIEYATKDHVHCFIIPVYIKAIHKTFYEGAKRIFHIYFIYVLFCAWVYIVLVVCVFISDLSLFISISYT